MGPGRQLGSPGDEGKKPLKLEHLKNRFLRCQPCGRFPLSSPGPWKLDPNYIYIYIYIDVLVWFART